jgi:hypothetical protein
MATEYYKEIADKKTINELKQLVGKKHLINFEELGNKKLDLEKEELEEYDESESDAKRYLIEESKEENGEENDETLPD